MASSEQTKTCGNCAHYDRDVCYLQPPVVVRELSSNWRPGTGEVRYGDDEVWGRPPVHETDRACSHHEEAKHGE